MRSTTPWAPNERIKFPDRAIQPGDDIMEFQPNRTCDTMFADFMPYQNEVVSDAKAGWRDSRSFLTRW